MALRSARAEATVDAAAPAPRGARARAAGLPEGAVLLLDGFSLLYRAHFALPPMSTERGEPTSAVYGAAALVLKLLREAKPIGIGVALDAPVATFRHAAYAPYKAQRGAAPSALSHQVERFCEVIDAFGFPKFAVPGYEADDVLATLVREMTRDGRRAIVVSGDRDCLQLAKDGASVLLVGRGGRDVLYDERTVFERFGVTPEQLPDYVALVGDPSDNLPGARGIGPRTAAVLLARYGSIAEIVAHTNAIGSERHRAALVAHADELETLARLARLRDDVPLPAGPRYAPVTPAARERVRALFETLEFDSLLRRMDAALGAVDT